MNTQNIVIWTIPVKVIPQTGGEIQNNNYYQGLLNDNRVIVLFKKRIGIIEALKYIINDKDQIIFITDNYYRNKYILLNWLFCLNKNIKKVSIVWRPYNTPFNKSLKGLLSYLAFWLYLSPCNAICVNSQATRRWVNKIVKRKKIIICTPSPNIFGHYVKRTREDTVKLLIVGYFVNIKGQCVLLDALKYLMKYDWKLILIGAVKDLEYFKVVNSMIKEHSMGGRVEIINDATQEQISNSYEKADIYIQPSLEEGYGMAICEAMTFGLPIIGSDIGGIPEVVEYGVNGYLVKPGNDEDLKDKIEILINNFDLRMQMGKNSYKLSQSFMNWQQNTEQFIKEILKLHKI